MFNIFDVDNERLYTDSNDDLRVYSTAPLAAEECKRLQAVYGGKFSLRPAADKDDKLWRQREQGRIDDGTYARPHFFAEFSKTSHYLHVSKTKPGMLAYTKDESKGRADIQSTISLAGYFERYTAGYLAPYEERLKTWLARDASRATVKFATTPDEIAKVYTNYDNTCGQVSTSCMRYENDDFSDDTDTPPQHPCSIYGAGDLAVAYIANEDGKTTHRALCWPDKLVYSRVYGDDSTLHVELKKLGYKKSCNYYSNGTAEFGLEGARLLRIENENDSSIFLVPYCDDIGTARDGKKFLILDENGRIDLRRTDGWSDDTSDGRSGYDYTCDHCEEGCEDTYTVYISRGNSEQWCEGCRDNGTFYCRSTGENYDSYRVDQVEVSGETWCEYAVRDGAEECARSGHWFLAEDMRDVVVDEQGNTERWHHDDARRQAWICQKSGASVSDDVEPAHVWIAGEERDCAPHIANDRTRHALAVYVPKARNLKLTGDDPAQLRIDLTNRDALYDCFIEF